jgi:hypothetical protein
MSKNDYQTLLRHNRSRRRLPRLRHALFHLQNPEVTEDNRWFNLRRFGRARPMH